MRPPELNIKRARGFLLIVAIFVLVVIAVAIAALGNMTSADIRAGSGHAKSEQAYFAATSGIEYAANRYYNGTDCSALNASGAAVGNASFSLTPVLYQPTNGTGGSSGLSTTTTATLTAGSATVPVSSTTGFATNGRIQIDSEKIDYTGVTGTSFTGLVRGAAGTTASAHLLNAVVSQPGSLPNLPTNTSAALTAGSTSIPVVSTTRYAPNGRILIDSELINYTSKSTTSFDGLTRGVGGTTAAAHSNGAIVSQNICSVSSAGFVSSDSVVRNISAALGLGTNSNAGALGTMGPDAMVVYAKGTALTTLTATTAPDPNVYFRLWDSSTNSWSAAEQKAQPVGSTPVFITVQFARTRNEAIMGVLDGNNDFYLQVWNGRTWTMLNGGAPLATTSSNTSRNFQIAYEYANDRALIVYQNSSRDPQYAIWNGSSLTLSGMILSPSTTYPTASGGTRHLWFRLAPRNVAGSNDILMMSTDTGQDVFGVRWTGSAWSNMGTATRWDTSTSNTNNHEAIDVAWQSDGSKAVFVYGDATNQGIRYRTWTAGTSTLGALSAAGSMTTPGGYTSARFEWVRLYPGPANNILLMLQSAVAGTNPSLESVTWNSATAAFNTTPTGHENGNSAGTGIENFGVRGFDFAWETSPSVSGSGWLLWASRAGGVESRYFTTPSTWGVTNAVIRDRTLFLSAAALTPSGRLAAGAYRSTSAASVANQITESLTVTGGGATWPNAATPLWDGPMTLQQGERVFVAERNSGYINAGTSGTGLVSALQTQESR